MPRYLVAATIIAAEDPSVTKIDEIRITANAAEDAEANARTLFKERYGEGSDIQLSVTDVTERTETNGQETQDRPESES